jgi:hypothetical protein
MKDSQPAYKIWKCETIYSGLSIDNPTYNSFQIETPQNSEAVWIVICDLFESRIENFLLFTKRWSDSTFFLKRKHIILAKKFLRLYGPKMLSIYTGNNLLYSGKWSFVSVFFSFVCSPLGFSPIDNCYDWHVSTLFLTAFVKLIAV